MTGNVLDGDRHFQRAAQKHGSGAEPKGVRKGFKGTQDVVLFGEAAVNTVRVRKLHRGAAKPSEKVVNMSLFFTF